LPVEDVCLTKKPSARAKIAVPLGFNCPLLPLSEHHKFEIFFKVFRKF
jgi:hypothetical protein